MSSHPTAFRFGSVQRGPGAPRPVPAAAVCRGSAARLTRLAHFHPTTSQLLPISADQVPNNAGGFVFQITDMQRLRRFLVLGSDGGTFYASEKTLGIENAQCLQRLIAAGKGVEAVQEIVRFSVDNRAPKQEPILFALALCARCTDGATRTAAYEAVSAVCRIPTHLFSFMEYCQLLSKAHGGRGQGRAHRRAISAFYSSKQAQHLGFLCTKYASRNGWSHRDVLRVSHVQPKTPAHNMVFQYIIKGFKSLAALPEAVQAATQPAATAEPAAPAPPALTAEAADDGADGSDLAPSADEAEELRRTYALLQALEELKAQTEVEGVVRLVRQFRLAREHIPTQFLNSIQVWQALLPQMPLTALIRNLGKMTAIGLLQPDGEHSATVVGKLSDSAQLQRSRVHPFSVLLALRTYQQGHGEKGSLRWQPVPEIVAALNNAFYAAFANVQASGKRFLLALDVSGSMTCGNICGASNITPRVASAAMAMVTARTEPSCHIMAFSDDFIPLDITPADSLEDVMHAMDGLPFSSTDCSLPMQWALAHELPIDVFVVYTDNETYAGSVHPAEALRAYRAASGIEAKLVVVGMTATEFSIADPSDGGMLDVVGFDAAAPEIMSSFARGDI